MSGLPLRGQRTKSHFRTNRRKGAGIKKKVTKWNENTKHIQNRKDLLTRKE